MIERAEIISAVEGSWRLLKADPQGMRYFDQSLEGFFRSFGVIVLVMPALVIDILVKRSMTLTLQGLDSRVFPDVLFFASQLGSALISWVGYPLLLAAIAGPLGLSSRYVPFMVARNWSTLIGILPFFAGELLFAGGIMSLKGLELVLLIAQMFNLYYAYQVARIGAAVPTGTAIALVTLDFLFTLLTGTVADRLVGI